MTSMKLLILALLLFMPLICLSESNINDEYFEIERNGLALEELMLNIEEKQESVSMSELAQWIDTYPVLFFDSGDKAEVENINYCPSDPILCELLVSDRDRITTGKKGYILVRKDEIKKYLEDLGRRFNKDPVNAKFEVKDGKAVVFTLAENGIKLNEEEGLDAISAELLKNNSRKTKREIALSCKTIEPEIKSDAINSMGIDTLIGEGKSNFRGSPKNRIHNINVGSSRFHGFLIKPGEEFSFVETLGPVDGDHGYMEELVIKKDKTEPEFGGGICQISTTTFRAAIYSGLKITARRNHAYPVAYYNPQGMDATVYIPRPDLRFVNNTPGYILIQTKIEGTELIFQFYGTDDGRQTEIKGPYVLERNEDGSMKTSFTQIVRDKDGNEIINDTFKSNYDSPSKYPHPGEEQFTEKPEDWSKKQWKEYKKAHGMD